MSVGVMMGRVASAACGMELMARTGMRQRDTQVAWATNAARNLGGDFLIESKRESEPSERMRRKRNVPTVIVSININPSSIIRNWSKNTHLVAQTATAVLSSTCLQLKAFGPPAPLKASSKLGQAGLILPAA